MARPAGRGIASLWEWVAGAVSGVVVLAILISLLTQTLGEERAPDLVAEADSVNAVSGGYLARFTVMNRGTRTAAGVLLAGELWQDSVLLESSTATLDYVPGRSRRQGGFFFRHDPSRLTLRIRPLGYQNP